MGTMHEIGTHREFTEARTRLEDPSPIMPGTLVRPFCRSLGPMICSKLVRSKTGQQFAVLLLHGTKVGPEVDYDALKEASWSEVCWLALAHQIRSNKRPFSEPISSSVL